MTTILENAPTNDSFTDAFVREVRVNYLPSTVRPVTITGPATVAEFFRSVMLDNSREQFAAMFLDGSHQIASYSLVSIGTANQATVHPREVFQRAILAGAVSLVIAHNHPSGNLTPSEADLQTTRKLKQVGELLMIPFLDHVIVTDNAHNSLRETTELW